MSTTESIPRFTLAAFFSAPKPCEDALADLGIAYNKLADQLEEAWEQAEFSWAIGLFEGEGWIGFVRPWNWKRTARYCYPRIAVESTDEDVVVRFAHVMGCGNLNGPRFRTGGSHRKASWKWDASGADARAVLTRMLPHLGERRRCRAQEALEA